MSTKENVSTLRILVCRYDETSVACELCNQRQILDELKNEDDGWPTTQYVKNCIGLRLTNNIEIRIDTSYMCHIFQ